jgi:hypothetical protein
MVATVADRLIAVGALPVTRNLLREPALSAWEVSSPVRGLPAVTLTWGILIVLGFSHASSIEISTQS